MTIGSAWLRELRADIGFTQHALAEICGVTGATICRWERGTRRIPRSAVLLLHAAFPEQATRGRVAPPRGNG
jgi:transcriptional regulator with XRE-family HTH domain